MHIPSSGKKLFCPFPFIACKSISVRRKDEEFVGFCVQSKGKLNYEMSTMIV
jgi:hypothetical protein